MKYCYIKLKSNDRERCRKRADKKYVTNSVNKQITHTAARCETRIEFLEQQLIVRGKMTISK